VFLRCCDGNCGVTFGKCKCNAGVNEGNLDVVRDGNCGVTWCGGNEGNLVLSCKFFLGCRDGNCGVTFGKCKCNAGVNEGNLDVVRDGNCGVTWCCGNEGNLVLSCKFFLGCRDGNLDLRSEYIYTIYI